MKSVLLFFAFALFGLSFTNANGGNGVREELRDRIGVWKEWQEKVSDLSLKFSYQKKERNEFLYAEVKRRGEDATLVVNKTNRGDKQPLRVNFFNSDYVACLELDRNGALGIDRLHTPDDLEYFEYYPENLSKISHAFSEGLGLRLFDEKIVEIESVTKTTLQNGNTRFRCKFGKLIPNAELNWAGHPQEAVLEFSELPVPVAMYAQYEKTQAAHEVQFLGKISGLPMPKIHKYTENFGSLDEIKLGEVQSTTIFFDFAEATFSDDELRLGAFGFAEPTKANR